MPNTPGHILTLVAPCGLSLCDGELVARLRTAFADLPADWQAMEQLAPGEALAVPVARGDAADAHRIRAWLDTRNMPVDVAITPAQGRRKKLLVADMDQTVIAQESIDEMAAVLDMREQIAAITERAMSGEIAFEPAVKQRVQLLRGLTVADLQRVMDTRLHLSPGARALVQTMRAHDAYTALISGGFTFFAEQVAKQTGFHEFQANRLMMVDGAVHGVDTPIMGRQAKRQALYDLCHRHGFERSETMAVGDGANDLALLRAAGIGVAYRAKPIVAKEADVQINHADLRALLYIQGYGRDMIITS